MSEAKPGQTLILSRSQRVVELTRPWILLLLYLVFSIKGWWLLAVPAAFATCLAAFVQMHDSIHSSLGLSKKWQTLFLTLSGQLLLKSGHALQVTHLRHHGRCLSKEDPEGQPANWPFLQVIFQGPFHMLSLRMKAIQLAPRKRRIQLSESFATLAILVGALLLFFRFGSLTGLVYWAIAAFLSATMPIWAAYLPHRLAPKNPAILVASRLARFWTPVVSSFAFHHVHHAFPKVPTALLPIAAQHLPIAESTAHHHHH